MKASAPGIRAQFVVAGALLVTTTAVSAAWSAFAFREVSRVVDDAIRGSEQATAATSTLEAALEDEDDALLLTLTDEARGRRELARERDDVEAKLEGVDRVLEGPQGRDTSRAIASAVAAYHAAGDDLLLHARDKDARLRYDEMVTPRLARAVAASQAVRDDRFRSAQRVASWARDRATRATQILLAVTAAALVVSLLVALYLARAVVNPLRDLTRAAEAMRRGDFETRVAPRRSDEIGTLADAFNRMAEDLEAFKKANVGEVIRAKETLEATLAALPDAVFVIEPEGGIATANPRANLVLRASQPPDDAPPSSALERLPVPDRTKLVIGEALRGEATESNEAVDLAQAVPMDVGGAPRKLLPRVVSIQGPGDRRGAVLVLSDVTELAHLDEMRTELVAVASHELRTPLTTLRMTLLLLQERAASLGDRDRELVRTALLGVDQLAGTIDEFLDLTRIEAGQLRLNWDLVDVVTLVRREAESVSAVCSEAGLELDVDVPSERLAVRGDPPRLHVVLSNLLANAVKYTPRGAAIRVRVAREGDAAVIAIEDGGPGVPAEFRERVFEKFFRVEHQRADEAGVRGHGIGLYIAREVVEAHGGAIRCEEAAPRGARFVVTLPLAPPNGAA